MIERVLFDGVCCRVIDAVWVSGTTSVCHCAFTNCHSICHCSPVSLRTREDSTPVSKKETRRVQHLAFRSQPNAHVSMPPKKQSKRPSAAPKKPAPKTAKASKLIGVAAVADASPPTKCRRTEAPTAAADNAAVAAVPPTRDGAGAKLYVAAEAGRLAECRRLLGAGLPVDSVGGWRTAEPVVGEWHETALAGAARNGHLDVVKLFLENGASVGKADRDGQTPLLWAATKGHTAVVALLLEKGASVDSVNGGGSTALLMAAARDDAALVHLLLEKGASVNNANMHGITPLMHAAVGGRIGVLALLLEKGADVNARNRWGHTALYAAAQEGRVASVRALLAAGADAGIADNEGKTPVEVSRRDMFVAEKEEIPDLLRAALLRAAAPVAAAAAPAR